LQDYTSALQCHHFPLRQTPHESLQDRHAEPAYRPPHQGIAALREHRSIANLIEVLIRKHCDANGISIPEQHALFGETDDE
jgi:hypothetical protein